MKTIDKFLRKLVRKLRFNLFLIVILPAFIVIVSYLTKTQSTTIINVFSIVAPFIQVPALLLIIFYNEELNIYHVNEN